MVVHSESASSPMLAPDLRASLHEERHKAQLTPIPRTNVAWFNSAPIQHIDSKQQCTLTYEIQPGMSIDLAVENAFRLFCQTHGTTPDLFLSAKNGLKFVAINTDKTHTYVQYVNISSTVGENQVVCIAR